MNRSEEWRNAGREAKAEKMSTLRAQFNEHILEMKIKKKNKKQK